MIITCGRFDGVFELGLKKEKKKKQVISEHHSYKSILFFKDEW